MRAAPISLTWGNSRTKADEIQSGERCREQPSSLWAEVMDARQKAEIKRTVMFKGLRKECVWSLQTGRHGILIDHFSGKGCIGLTQTDPETRTPEGSPWPTAPQVNIFLDCIIERGRASNILMFFSPVIKTNTCLCAASGVSNIPVTFTASNHFLLLRGTTVYTSIYWAWAWDVTAWSSLRKHTQECPEGCTFET